jgi:ketopantoate reductase
MARRDTGNRTTYWQNRRIAGMSLLRADFTAEGAQLAADEPDRIMSTLLTYPADAGTSMYFDRLAGRRFEVEALTGAIVAAGERHHLQTPLNRMLLTLLRATSDGPAAIGENETRSAEDPAWPSKQD